MRTLSEIKALYQLDEHEWLTEQIDLLRKGWVELLDKENLIQYLGEMAGRDRRELESRFVILLQHMLKFTVQPKKATNSWRLSILEQQREINKMFTETPSLKSSATDLFISAYKHAVIAASVETGIARNKFPVLSWTIKQALEYEI